MSRQFVGASLAGCVPSPHYHSELKTLQDAMDKADLGDHRWMTDVAVSGFWFNGHDNKDYDNEVKTDDDYQWFSARMFVDRYGGFVLLMPWHSDREKKDGSTADRALQIHCFGNVNHTFVQNVLHELLQWLTHHQERVELCALSVLK